MEKGIIYVASTETDEGLIKIGITKDIKSRINQLKTDGYKRLLCRIEMAIEVEDYKSKERLLQRVFSKSRIGGTELFAEDIETVKELLLSFKGDLIYPDEKDVTREELIQNLEEERDEKENIRNKVVPPGVYFIFKNQEKFAELEITQDFRLKLKKGSNINSSVFKSFMYRGYRDKLIESNIISKENKLIEDFECPSFSTASSLVLGRSSNGWVDWKTSDAKTIDEKYRHNKELYKENEAKTNIDNSKELISLEDNVDWTKQKLRQVIINGEVYNKVNNLKDILLTICEYAKTKGGKYLDRLIELAEEHTNAKDSRQILISNQEDLSNRVKEKILDGKVYLNTTFEGNTLRKQAVYLANHLFYDEQIDIKISFK